MKLIRNVNDNVLSVFEGENELLSIKEDILSDSDNTVCMRLSGRFGNNTTHDFYDELMAISSVGKSIILDFSKVTYMASSCIRGILAVQQHMDQSGKSTLTIRCVPESIYQDFKKVGLTELLNIE